MPRRITLVRPSDMFRVMEDSMSNFMSDVGISADFPLSVNVNIKELSDRYEVTAKVPGFKKDEINISFHENALVLEGKINEEMEKKDGEFIVQEYKEGSFKRMINLPGKVDMDKVDAKLNEGVLTLTLPKLPEVLPKKIEISD
ncbi:MAG: Hsp20/alpha crystallin family protein [Candidatus Dojkabacteria bacterium]